MTTFDWLLIGTTAGLLVLGLRPALQNSVRWRVVVTPLASIIGSGFLVIAPLLGATVGPSAPLAMLAIVLAAYGIGAILRFNILNAEPKLDEVNKSDSIYVTERLSNVMLSIAYVISVAFYLRLLSSFVLRSFDSTSDVAANALTSAILVAIAFVGWTKGLIGLERLEKYSVTVKLCIIIALLLGLARFDLIHTFDTASLHPDSLTAWEMARVLGGMLLVVQGFETSRYMREEYSAIHRVQGMRAAQLLAAFIYVAFILLAMPLLHFVDYSNIDETSVIDIAGKAAIVLPSMLILAAVMSQFSAAVADTVGAGGLVAEETDRKLPSRAGYALVCALGVILVWTSNVFEIISLASRAFAGYYMLQSIVAVLVVRRDRVGLERLISQILFAAAAIGLLWIFVFAKPAA